MDLSDIIKSIIRVHTQIRLYLLTFYYVTIIYYSAAVDGVHVAHKITALIEGRSVTVTKRVDASVSDKKVAMPNKKRE